MYRCKYIVTGIWKNGDDQFDIKTEYFKTFMRDSNYDKENLSKILCSLTIDKNYIDKIVLYAKTASIFLYVDKIHLNQDDAVASSDATKTQELWSGEYSYIITDDINYNKEIDYANPVNKENKDVHKSIFLGLFFKQANVFNNSVVNNDVIINTALMNVVMNKLTEYPTVIEPFDYNPIVDQLTIPPQESLSKFISFMNSYKVFYNTQYRFFIDCDCVYLLSSAGKATEKQGEKYSTVFFTIQSLDKASSLVQGMEEDDTNKRYSIDINVKDSKYTLDNTTCKYMNEISSILDPSKTQSILNCDAMNNAIQQINKQKEKINEKIHSIVPTIKAIPTKIRGFKIDIIDKSNKVKKDVAAFQPLTDTLIEQIKAIPEERQDSSSSSGGSSSGSSETYFIMSGKDKQDIIKTITDYMNTVLAEAEQYCKLKSLIGGTTNTTINTLMSTTMIPSAVNSVSSINVFDNKGLLSGFHNAAKVFNANNLKDITENLMPKGINGQNASGAANSILSIAKDIESKIESGGTPSSSSGVTEPDVKATVTSMTPLASEIDSCVNNTQSILEQYSNIPDVLGDIHAAVESTVQEVIANAIDLGTMLSEFKVDWSGIGEGIQQNIAGILKSMTDAGGQILSSGFKFGSLQQIEESISKVKDIAQLGKLGISAFDLKLNLDAGSSAVGSSIIKLDNDNYNMLKNIKSTIENKANRLVLNKNDLDSEVFTPNKSYIIKNYDAHSNKDGEFLLSRKIEFFVREDDKFTMNTMLEFDKVAESSKDKDNKDASTTADIASKDADSNSNKDKVTSITDLLTDAGDVINSITTGTLNIDAINKVVSDADSVRKAYKSMNSTNTQMIDQSSYYKPDAETLNLIGPNGVAYDENDIKYYTNLGYTKLQALDILSRKDKYTK